MDWIAPSKYRLHEGQPPMRILIVEDEYLIAEDLAEAVRHLGGEVIGPALSLDEANTLLATLEIDAAVLDVNVRGQSALPLADSCSKAGIPFVVMTGYDRADLGVHNKAQCFQKPADSVEVIRAVFSMVRQPLMQT
jgi:CheY-like chemotaxis protein